MNNIQDRVNIHNNDGKTILVILHNKDNICIDTLASQMSYCPAFRYTKPLSQHTEARHMTLYTKGLIY